MGKQKEESMDWGWKSGFDTETSRLTVIGKNEQTPFDRIYSVQNIRKKGIRREKEQVHQVGGIIKTNRFSSQRSLTWEMYLVPFTEA